MNENNNLTLKQHFPYLLLLLVASIIFRLLFATPYLFDGDPVNYFLGAQNLFSGNGYYAMGIPVIWPVGYSLTIIPFFLLFSGVNAAIASSIIFSTLGMIMLYLIGAELFSRRTGLTAALLLGFSETFFFSSVNVASDTHALFFTLSGIYFFIILREHYSSKLIILSGLFFSMAVITRYQSATFILLPFLYVLWEKRKRELPNFLKQSRNFLTPIIIFFGAMIPFAIVQFQINYAGYGNIFPIQYAAATSSGFDTETFKIILNPIRIIYRLFFSFDIYAPIGIPLLVTGYFVIRNRPKILSLLTIWTLLGILPMIFYLVVPRYFFIVSAPLFLLIAVGGEEIIKRIGELPFLSKFGSYKKRILLISVLLIILLPFAAQTFRLASSNKNHLSAMGSSFSWVKENTAPESAVLTQSPYYGHFNIWEAIGQDIWVGEYYSDRKTYSVFDNVDSILFKHPDTYLIMNEYWQREENLLMMYPAANIKGINHILADYNTELVKTFETKRNFLLWKLTTHTNHPDAFYKNEHLFKIYKVSIDSLR